MSVPFLPVGSSSSIRRFVSPANDGKSSEWAPGTIPDLQEGYSRSGDLSLDRGDVVAPEAQAGPPVFSDSSSSDTSSDVPPPRHRVRRPTSLPIRGALTASNGGFVGDRAGCGRPASAAPPGMPEPFLEKTTRHGGCSRRGISRSLFSSSGTSFSLPDDFRDSSGMEEILSRTWAHYGCWPLAQGAAAKVAEREGELSYIRATQAWELAILHRNLVVRLLVDGGLDDEARRVIEE
jgi:hypothetical protein